MKKSGLYEIVAFCDIVRERAEKAKEEYGTEDSKVFEDYKVLIKEDLDVVYVTTPNRSHAEISIAVSYTHLDVYKRQQLHCSPWLCTGMNSSREWF